MISPEMPKKAESTLKEQLEIGLAGSIGVTAGLIFWQAILTSGVLAWKVSEWLAFVVLIGFSVWLSLKYFDPFIDRQREGGYSQGKRRLSLRIIGAATFISIASRLIDTFLERNLILAAFFWILIVISAGSVTFAWAFGLRQGGKRAVLIGTLTGAVAPNVVLLALLPWALRLGRSGEILERMPYFTLEWGLYGLLGGLAIVRGWGSRPFLRVAMGLGLASVGVMLATFIVALFFEYPTPPSFWFNIAVRQILFTLGWVWGLTLFPHSDEILRVPQSPEEI